MVGDGADTRPQGIESRRVRTLYLGQKVIGGSVSIEFERHDPAGGTTMNGAKDDFQRVFHFYVKLQPLRNSRRPSSFAAPVFIQSR